MTRDTPYAAWNNSAMRWHGYDRKQWDFCFKLRKPETHRRSKLIMNCHISCLVY